MAWRRWVVDFRHDRQDGKLARALKGTKWIPPGSVHKNNLWDFYWLNWKDFGECPCVAQLEGLW